MKQPILIKGAIYHASPITGSKWRQFSEQFNFISGLVEYRGVTWIAKSEKFEFRIVDAAVNAMLYVEPSELDAFLGE